MWTLRIQVKVTECLCSWCYRRLGITVITSYEINLLLLRCGVEVHLNCIYQIILLILLTGCPFYIGRLSQDYFPNDERGISLKVEYPTLCRLDVLESSIASH